MLACLCCGGWFDVYGKILSVNLGFLYMEVVHLVGVLWMVISSIYHSILPICR